MKAKQSVPTKTDLIVHVKAPARLHLGFLDLNGSGGRKFGSIGLAIDSHYVNIKAQLAPEISITGADISATTIQRIHEIIERFYITIGKNVPIEQQGVSIDIIELIPSHAGLGSGTQLAITVSTALCRLHYINLDTRDVAAQLDRGSRSGIGIATFDHGGFIVDGGLSDFSVTPPLLVHYDFPENWRVMLIMDTGTQGIHGEQELQAFDSLPVFPLADSQAICHHVLMKLLPAIVEQEIEIFGQAVTDIQSLIGDHFAPAQGGRYTSQRVAALLNYAQDLGHTGIAQSSWGPTGCIFVKDDNTANQLLADLKSHCDKIEINHSDLSFIITSANEHGADITIQL